MLVVVDRRRDSGVVLVPLGSLDFAVAVLVSEALEEFEEDLVFGHLSGLDLGVHAAVVDASKVSSGDLTVAVLVELQESLVNHRLSLGVEGALCQKFMQKVRVARVKIVQGLVFWHRTLKIGGHLRGFQSGIRQS